MKNTLFLIIGFLILPSLAQADLAREQAKKPDPDEFMLSSYIEAGKRSTSEDYEEEDTDDDYTYHNYHLKFSQEISDRLSYNISSFIYDKNYKSQNALDNISRTFKTTWSYYLRKHKEESLKLDLKLNWKEKRFKNTPASEYDQVKIAPTLRFKKKDLYAVNLSAGLDNFNYLDADQKDQFKIFSKIGGQRYFLGKKLKLTSSAKIEQLEQKKINRERTKHNLMSGFNYIFDLPWLYKITARVNWGERDTKEEEERDQDSDYEYQRYYTKTEHKINPGLKTNLKYQFFKKDYAAIDLDHRGFYIRNNWDYEILNDQAQRAWLDFKVEHKDVSYALKSNNDYQKETFKIKVNYKKKKNWKVSASLQESFYNFNDSSRDKNRYYAALSGEKLFLDGDLVMSIDFKHRYTENKQDNDTNEESVRVSFKYNF